MFTSLQAADKRWRVLLAVAVVMALLLQFGSGVSAETGETGPGGPVDVVPPEDDSSDESSDGADDAVGVTAAASCSTETRLSVATRIVVVDTDWVAKGTPLTVTAHLQSRGKLLWNNLPSRSVTIVVTNQDGATVTSWTDTTGPLGAVAKLWAPSTPGHYTVTATFDGDDKYCASDDDTALHVAGIVASVDQCGTEVSYTAYAIPAGNRQIHMYRHRPGFDDKVAETAFASMGKTGTHSGTFAVDSSWFAAGSTSGTFSAWVQAGEWGLVWLESNKFGIDSASCVSVTVHKVTDGGTGDETFTFTGNGAPIGPPAGIGDGDGFTVHQVPAGAAYTIAESLPGDWMLASVVCDDIVRTLENGHAVTVTPDPGEDMTCVFTNVHVPPGTLVVRKQVADNGPWPDGGFEFEYEGPGGDEGTFGLADTGASQMFQLAYGDEVRVREINVPRGWSLVDVVCTVDGKDDSSLVESGEIWATYQDGKPIVCTFINEAEPGFIQVEKIVQSNRSGDQTRDFTFRLSDMSDEKVIKPGDIGYWDGVPSGTYTLTEDAIGSRWSVTDISCTMELETDDDEVPGLIKNLAERAVTFDLPPLAEVTCVFTNKYTPPPSSSIPTIPGDNGGDDEADDEEDEDIPIVPEEPGAGPDPGDDTDGSIDVPSPGAATDLPLTGGSYFWHLLGGTALAAAGSARLLLSRRRRAGSPE